MLQHCEMGGVGVQWQQAVHVIGCYDRRSCKIEGGKQDGGVLAVGAPVEYRVRFRPAIDPLRLPEEGSERKYRNLVKFFSAAILFNLFLRL